MTGMMLLYCSNLLLLFVTAMAYPERPRAKYDYSEVKIQGKVAGFFDFRRTRLNWLGETGFKPKGFCWQKVNEVGMICNK